MNATSIALHYLENPTEEQIALIDTYATLSALDHTDSTQNNLVKDLSNASCICGNAFDIDLSKFFTSSVALFKSADLNPSITF